MEKIDENTKQHMNTGLICLDIVAKMNAFDIDMRGIVREYGIESANIEPEELIRIAKNAGFKIKNKKLKIKDVVPKYPTPAILRMKEDNSYAVLLAVKEEEGKALILSPYQQQPFSRKIDEFVEIIGSKTVLCAPRSLRFRSEPAAFPPEQRDSDKKRPCRSRRPSFCFHR